MFVLLMSLPTRERGLKQIIKITLKIFIKVAPYKGAGIETSVGIQKNHTPLGRSLQGSGD